jgi:hypothetical protein
MSITCPDYHFGTGSRSGFSRDLFFKDPRIKNIAAEAAPTATMFSLPRSKKHRG